MLDSIKNHRNALTFLLVFVLAAQLPFLCQAFHMDDGLFLHVAKNIYSNPLFPQDTGILFEGIWARDLASMEHPPLTAYVLAAGAFLLHGFREPSLHGIFLIFSLMLAVSMYSLAFKFSRHPLAGTILLLVLPSVAVLSHTLMADFPHLALWTASVAAFIKGVDENLKGFVFLSSLLVSCAVLTSLAGFCLVPLLAYYAWLSRRSSAACWMVSIVLLLVGCWLYINYLHFHRFTPGFVFSYYLRTEQVYRPAALVQKIGYLCAALGGITVFPLCLLLPAFVRRKTAFGIGAISALLLCRFTDARTYSLMPRLLFFLFAFVGSIAIYGFLLETIKSVLQLRIIHRVSAGGFLGIWFCGVFLFCTVFYMTGSGRYLLPLMPPLVLMFVRELETICRKRSLAFVLAGSITATACVALLLSVADYQFAKGYRNFRDFILRQNKTNSRLWFTGEWGFRAYLEDIGGQELGRRDARPQPGDLIAIPQLATPYTTLFHDSTNLNSIVMIAPSRMQFAIPALNRDSTLIMSIGLPFWKSSDGMNLDVTFESQKGHQVLLSRRLKPESGRAWGEERIPLADIAWQPGLLSFDVSVGEEGNATADWLAIAKARIEGPSVYDFMERLSTARIDSEKGVNYHTAQNRPVFPMEVTLAQQPALHLISKWEYSPAVSLRLVDNTTHAGFWSMGWGMLPFSFAHSGGSTLETISIYKVIRKIDSYGLSQLSWYAE